jgi:hypothetical protein
MPRPTPYRSPRASSNRTLRSRADEPVPDGHRDTVVEPNEPRLLSFQAYADPESNEVTVVQIHPDPESMVNHMSLITQHVALAYADYLEPGSRSQIYGTPRGGVLEKIRAMGGDGTTPRSHEPFAGFTRWP